jgi:hypothetical protein
MFHVEQRPQVENKMEGRICDPSVPGAKLQHRLDVTRHESLELVG